jgi:hypothetical protein
MKKKLSILSGIVVFLLAVVVNIQYALDGYGVSKSSLHAEVLAQTGTGTGTGGSGTGGSGTGYALKTVNTGSNAQFYITMNGLNYVHTCEYTQTICTGTGTVSCISHFYAYNCTPWKLVN